MWTSLLSKFSRPRKLLNPHKFVGVQDLCTSKSHVPLRVFYPTCDQTDHSRERGAGWFVRRVSYFIDGYMHHLNPKFRQNSVYRGIVHLFSMLLALLMPLAMLDIPMCKMNAKRKNGKQMPLIVFSHGLTGTGEEQAV